MPDCACAAELQRSFRHVEDAVFGVQKDAIIAGSELLAREDSKWASLYRCRA